MFSVLEQSSVIEVDSILSEVLFLRSEIVRLRWKLGEI